MVKKDQFFFVKSLFKLNNVSMLGVFNIFIIFIGPGESGKIFEFSILSNLACSVSGQLSNRCSVFSFSSNHKLHLGSFS